MTREGLQSIKPQLCATEEIVPRLIRPVGLLQDKARGLQYFCNFFGNFSGDYLLTCRFNNATSVARHTWKQDFDRIP